MSDRRIEGVRELFRLHGACEYLLDAAGPTGGQIAWIDQLRALPAQTWASWEISRQRGKTWAALLASIEDGGHSPDHSHVYLAQTGGNAKAIIEEFMKEVEEFVPPEWGLRHDKEASALVLNNGFQLAYFGTDNNQYRRKRGRKANRVLLDEAAFYSDLEDVEQVYVAQLMTTKGTGLYLSSPAVQMGHPFSIRCDAAKASGLYVNDSFWSNPRIDHEAVIFGEMKRLNLTREELLKSTAFRREFLAQRVLESTRAAIPAWTYEQSKLSVVDRVRPQYFDAYVALDVGKIGDPHAAIFGYHDFVRQVLYIEDELELRATENPPRVFAEKIKQKERELWGVDLWNGLLLGADEWRAKFVDVPDYLRHTISRGAPTQPRLRVGDNEHTMLNALCTEHGLAVFPTKKDEKHMRAQETSDNVGRGRIEIHPRCKRLITQLGTTVWNEARTAWERTSTDHGDLVDTLIYMDRNVSRHNDPRPPPADTMRGTFSQKPKGNLDALKGMF